MLMFSPSTKPIVKCWNLKVLRFRARQMVDTLLIDVLDCFSVHLPWHQQIFYGALVFFRHNADPWAETVQVSCPALKSATNRGNIFQKVTKFFVIPAVSCQRKQRLGRQEIVSESILRNSNRWNASSERDFTPSSVYFPSIPPENMPSVLTPIAFPPM